MKTLVKDFFNSIFYNFWWRQVKDIDELYFCGFKIKRWMDTNAFFRFANWAGMGICHELSALMVIVLKENKSATLYQGYDYDSNGKKTKHAWVEFKIPPFGWYVCDLMWTAGFARRSKYRQWFPRREVKWCCTHSEFWQLELSQILRQEMQRSDTSYIIDGLTLYISCGADRFGFNRNIENIRGAKPGVGRMENMLPIEVGDEIGWVTTLRDFVKNPRAKKPHMRSIRLAKRAYKDMQAASRECQSDTE